jgi:hypothetical protein
MHHPTDVVFGLLGGGAWLLVVLATMLPRPGAGTQAVEGAGESRPAPAAMSGDGTEVAAAADA